MKKLIFVLMVFVAATQAFAALSVTITEPVSGTLEIKYSGADANNLPRAFALDLSITSPGQFTALVPDSYFKGECNATKRGYGIYPARITFDVNNDVNEWGSPLANLGDPGAGGGEGSGHIVLEFASLYVEPNVPATSGTLCKLTYDCQGQHNLTVTMVDEDAYRGGLVFEDGTQGTVNTTLAVCVQDCMKSTTDTPPTPAAEYNAWVAWGKPSCWCGKRHCRGDADKLKTGLFWVGSLDLTIFKAAFNKQDGPLAAVPNGICADYDHTKTGLFRVGSLDLTIFKTYFNKQEVQVPCCDVAPTNCVLDPALDKYNYWTN